MVKIFVGNLSQSTEREDIQMLFEKYGKVTECDVLKNYGFVHMASTDEADKAIQELDGTSVKGSRMRVEKSTGKSSRGGGRGGGGKMRGGRGGGRGGDRYGGGYGDPYRRPPPPSYGGSRDYYDRGYGGGAPRDRMPMRGYEHERRPPMDDYGRDRGYYGGGGGGGGGGGYDQRRSDYDRYDRAPARDSYYSDRGATARPPPEYYNRARLPDPPVDRLADYSNGFDNNYYDRFYKKPTPPITQKSNGQGFLQSEPLYF